MNRKATLLGGILCTLQVLSLFGMNQNACQTATKEDQELTQWLIDMAHSQHNKPALSPARVIYTPYKSPGASPIKPPIPSSSPAETPASFERSPSPETLPNFPETFEPLREQAIKNIEYMKATRVCIQAALAAHLAPAGIIKVESAAKKSSKRIKRVSQTGMLADITNTSADKRKSRVIQKATQASTLRRSARIKNLIKNKENIA